MSSSTAHKFPSIFLSHGSPMLLLSKNNPVKQLWQRIGKKYHLNSKSDASPKAILLISAHYETKQNEIRIASRDSEYDLHYDFYGFPDELYKVKYHAKGSTELAQDIKQRIEGVFGKQIKVSLDTKYALDHGAFLPLIQLTGTTSQIPVVVMSVNTDLAPRVLMELGRQALAPLRDEIIIVGSGSEVHRIPDFFRATEVYGDVYPYTKESVGFSSKLREILGSELPNSSKNDLLSTIVTRNYGSQILPALARYREDFPHAEHQHPTDEHFRPIFYSIGAGVEKDNQVVKVQYLFQGSNPTGVVVFGTDEKV